MAQNRQMLDNKLSTIPEKIHIYRIATDGESQRISSQIHDNNHKPPAL